MRFRSADVESLTAIGVRRFLSLPDKVPDELRVKVKVFNSKKFISYRWSWDYAKNRDQVDRSLHQYGANRIIIKNSKISKQI